MADLLDRYGIRGLPNYDRLFGLPLFTLSGGLAFQNLGEPGSMPNFKISQVHQYLNNLSWNRGNHNVKFGTDLRWNRSDIFGGASAHGNFTFDGQFTRISFGDFLLGMPSQVNLTTLLTGQMRFRNYMFYVLDDWKVTSRLSLNLGVRYELNTPWVDKHNNMTQLELAPGPNFNQVLYAGHCGNSWECRSFYKYPKTNFAPRVGFAYQWTPKTVIRSGAGIFFGSQGSLGANGRAINNWPFNRTATVQSTANAPAIRLSDGLPPNFLGAPTAPPNDANWTVWDQGYKWPTVYQWNFAIQRELPGAFSLTTAYVGSSTNFILDSYNWNGSEPGPPATERQRRKVPQWNNISMFSPFGHSSYHGLDVQLQRRYTSGLFLSMAYTWSHSIDNIPEQFGSGGGGLMDFRNFDINRGNSNFDIRHRYILSTAYELPFGRGKRWLNSNRLLNAVLGGWELSNMWSMQTGDYFTITVPNARQRLGATAIGNWWPDRVRDPRLDERTANRWFDTTAFASPRDPDGAWRLGNAGRAILNTDGMFNIDAGLKKAFAITESMRVQFRWEVFNLTNTPTLGTPNTNFESPDFGIVRSTFSTPRQMQFALRLEF